VEPRWSALPNFMHGIESTWLEGPTLGGLTSSNDDSSQEAATNMLCQTRLCVKDDIIVLVA